MTLLLAALGGYLCGSVPFGLLLTRWAGLGDIRLIGSGNIGATNVLRTGNRGLAAGVLVLDLLKGLVPVLLAVWLVGRDHGLVAGGAAILGHMFPAWLSFRGGKAVATAAGVVLALAWWLGLACLAIWAAVAAATRISSLAALAACAAAPLVALLAGDGWLALFSLLVASAVAAKHHANIRRLLAGTEPRIGGSRPTPAP